MDRTERLSTQNRRKKEGEETGNLSLPVRCYLLAHRQFFFAVSFYFQADNPRSTGLPTSSGRMGPLSQVVRNIQPGPLFLAAASKALKIRRKPWRVWGRHFLSVSTAGVRVLPFITTLRKVKGECRFWILQKRPGVCELRSRGAYFTVGDCGPVISSVPAGPGASAR